MFSEFQFMVKAPRDNEIKGRSVETIDGSDRA
jgi:hypothetical protein